MRHSYATVSIDAGVNPKVVSERIGHSSVAFTMQTYVQRTADLKRDADAAATIANLIGGDVPEADADNSSRAAEDATEEDGGDEAA